MEKVSFYTIEALNPDGSFKTSEYSDFKRRMSLDEKDARQLAQINKLISRIGDTFGAEDLQFRNEGTAVALPPHSFKFFDSDGEEDQGLRLYCVKINSNIVILLNGCRKTNQSPRRCPNCQEYFTQANAIAENVFDSINSGKLIVNGFELEFEDGFYLNY